MLGLDDPLTVLKGVSPSAALLGALLAYFGYLSEVGVTDPVYIVAGALFFTPPFIVVAIADAEGDSN